MSVAAIDIVNLALSRLGSPTLTSLLDNTNAARVMNLEYPIIRDSELRAHTWRFAIKRTSLPALVDVPLSGPFGILYQLPADYLKVLQVGEFWPSTDLSDYRTGPSTDNYSVENGKILTNFSAPLSLKYVAQITDTTVFDASFVTALACMLAWTACERITSSVEMRQLAMREYNQAILAATRANAIENVTENDADDSWILARLQ